MDDLEWKTLLKWMIWGYHYFRKHPYTISTCRRILSINRSNSEIFPEFQADRDVELIPGSFLSTFQYDYVLFTLEVQATKTKWLVFRMIHGARIPEPTDGQSLVDWFDFVGKNRALKMHLSVPRCADRKLGVAPNRSLPIMVRLFRYPTAPNRALPSTSSSCKWLL